MKKYVIKNSDGSEQNVMQAVHLSSKDADTLSKKPLRHTVPNRLLTNKKIR